MMYITGSRALNATMEWDRSNDYDLVLEDEVIQPEHHIDISPDGLETLAICKEYDSGVVVDTPVGPAKAVSPVGVMLMKRSHLHRPVGFAKHIRDYHKLHSLFKEKIDDRYRELLSIRTKLTKEKFGDRTPKLNKSKAEFFDDYVKKAYEHDSIHYATCYGERPIYEELKPDNDLVWCSKKMWDALDHDLKIKCVREEGFVIAIERYLMWKPKFPPKFAFAEAVSRICTTLTSGWFRDFAIDNWPEIMNHDYPFLDKFLEAGFKLQC